MRNTLASALIFWTIIVTISLSPHLALIRPVAAIQYNVSISNEQFSPQTVTIHSGDTIVWTNNDPFSYELYFQYANGTSYALSPFLQPGDTYSLGFPACNTFQYVTVQSPVTITGTVRSLIQGDVTGDCVVDISDLAIVGAAFGSTPLSPNWNPKADLDGDGIIDISDLAIVGAHFGQHGP